MESIVYDDCVHFFYPDSQSKHSYCIYSYLAVYRKRLGLTQQELADKCGLSQNTISNYENGVYCPSLVHAYIITQQLGLDPLTELSYVFDFGDLIKFN